MDCSERSEPELPPCGSNPVHVYTQSPIKNVTLLNWYALRKKARNVQHFTYQKGIWIWTISLIEIVLQVYEFEQNSIKFQWPSQVRGNTWASASWVSGSRNPPPHGRQRIFENYQQNLLRKLLKMHYLAYFSKEFNTPCVNSLRIWTKNTLFGNFEKILKNFDENSRGKLSF